jgi:hypothetical protein
MESITSIMTGRTSRLVMRMNREGKVYNLEFRHVFIDDGGRECPTRYAVSIPVKFYRNFREALFEVDQFLLDHGLVSGEDFGID